jgi:zinc transport system substrate-binding protein
MIKNLLYPFIAAFLIVLLPCVSHAAPRILVTIKPLHALVSAVTEGVTKPELLVTKNASPHSYSLRPNDAVKLQQAEVIFLVSREFEVFLAKSLATSSAKLVELIKSEGVHTLPVRQEHVWEAEHEHDHEHGHGHGGVDTHIWLDPQNAVAMVSSVAAILSQHDPVHKAAYLRNAARMEQEIERLDRELAIQLAPYGKAPFLVSHDAYQYFEKHYHLNGVGAVTLTPDQAPGARTIKSLQEVAGRRHVVCLFSEPQFPESFIKIIANQTGIRTGILDAEWGAVAGETGKAPYFSLMRGLAAAMSKCFDHS